MQKLVMKSRQQTRLFEQSILRQEKLSLCILDLKQKQKRHVDNCFSKGTTRLQKLKVQIQNFWGNIKLPNFGNRKTSSRTPKLLKLKVHFSFTMVMLSCSSFFLYNKDYLKQHLKQGRENIIKNEDTSKSSETSPLKIDNHKTSLLEQDHNHAHVDVLNQHYL